MMTSDLEANAQWHVDTHVCKMPTEAMQICSTAIALLSQDLYEQYKILLYKPAYIHHPIVQWASKDGSRICLVAEYGFALAEEFRYRYNHMHATESKLYCVKTLFANHRTNDPYNTWQTLPQAMPEQYKKDNDVFTAYRNYYINAKAHLHRWTNRTKPPFFPISGGELPA